MSEVSTTPDGLLTIEAIQKVLNRSRASVYRYANTEADEINPPFNPKFLNAEIRKHKDEPLLFHPNEVARFSRDVLGIKAVTIAVQEPPETATQELLRKILVELQAIHQLLADKS